eukprot:Seg954.3 transcript_id=Seg954.3/GoldUCD/mRNA.D3Y31 product="3-ketodihydrosphingosine reductase" protein_id=Seg954.3/GoldUCD/D3Y31
MLLFIFVIILVVVCTLCFLDWIVRSITVKSKLEIKDRHVMITGGSSGIGLSVAKLFVGSGANVTLVARNKLKLAQAVMALEDNKTNPDQKICIVSIDLTKDFNVIQNAYVEAKECHGPVDLLVNCAGYALCSTFKDANPDDFKMMMDTNFFGAVNMTKCVIDDMVARRNGHITFVSSIAGQLGLYGYTAYASSKYAIRGLAESLLSELKPHNIGVSVAFPPDTDTPGFERENESKPEATRLISEAGGLFSSDEVAKIIVDGIKNRQYLIPCGFDGFAMNTVTCGGAPASSLCELFCQVLLMGPIRLVMLFYLWNFTRIIKKCTQKEEGDKRPKSD